MQYKARVRFLALPIATGELPSTPNGLEEEGLVQGPEESWAHLSDSSNVLKSQRNTTEYSRKKRVCEHPSYVTEADEKHSLDRSGLS